MVAVVVEQTFGVAIVVLNEEILVFFFEKSIVYFHDGVEVEVPAAAFHCGDGKSPSFIVGCHLKSALVKPGIVEKILVVFSVYDRYPGFGVHHQVRGEKHVSAKRYPVPAA